MNLFDDVTHRVDRGGAGSDGGPDALPPEARFGPYRLLEEIGRGGQGAVYLAEDSRLKRRVALKLLSGVGGLTPEARIRFRREAEVTSRLEHPGLCTVFDFGEQDGIPYLAMQYVEGRSLDRLITDARSRAREDDSFAFSLSASEDASREQPTTEAERGGESRPRADGVAGIIAFFEEAARALHVAHEAGLVHRDIKPGNLMVARDGSPVILDFGLARDDAGEGPTLTATDAVMGTPAYMSPEQVAAIGPLDRQTDVYSLGATLFECLTLERPFAAPTREALYRAILTADAPRARSRGARIPADLEVVLEVALEKDRNRRYQSAEALAADLEAVRQVRPIAARPISLFGRAWRWARRNPKLTVAAAAGALVIGLPALIGFLSFVSAREPLARKQEIAEARGRSEQRVIEGFLLNQDGRLKQALQAFREADVEGVLPPEAVAGMVLVHLDRREWSGALEVLDRHPDAVNAYAGLRALRTYARAKLEGDSEVIASRKAELEPAKPFDFFLIGVREVIRAESGDRGAWKRGQAALLQAILRSPAPRPIFYHQGIYAASNAGDEAAVRQLSDAMLAIWPDRPAACFWAGMAWRQLGELDEGLAIIERGLALDAGFAKLWFAKGVVRANLGEDEAAHECLEEATRLDPSWSEPVRLQGMLRLKSGDAVAALARLRAAVEVDPEDDDAFANLAQVLVQHGEKEEAVAAYEAALAIDPHYVPWRLELAELLADLGRFEAVLAQAMLCVEHSPEAALEAARRAALARLFVTAATLHRELERKEPALFAAAPRGTRPLAARLALRAGTGASLDRALLSEGEIPEWRRQARVWLEVELAGLKEAASEERISAPELRRRLRRWQRDRVFRAVREPDELAALDEAEARRWTAFWDAVAEALE